MPMSSSLSIEVFSWVYPPAFPADANGEENSNNDLTAMGNARIFWKQGLHKKDVPLLDDLPLSISEVQIECPQWRLAESHHEGHEAHEDGIRWYCQSFVWQCHRDSLIPSRSSCPSWSNDIWPYGDRSANSG